MLESASGIIGYLLLGYLSGLFTEHFFDGEVIELWQLKSGVGFDLDFRTRNPKNRAFLIIFWFPLVILLMFFCLALLGIAIGCGLAPNKPPSPVKS